MTAITIDIVVPVWRKPDQARNCLVHLMQHTPGVRLVILDNDSDRDTERVLQELADASEERALLLRNDVNTGFVRGVNQGLARCEAPYRAFVKGSTLVPPGWFEPLLAFAREHPDAGILVPRSGGQEGVLPDAPLEVEAGNLCAMVVTAAAYQAIGGLDEGMDDGLWCLKDYTRRACAKGFMTYSVPGPAVQCARQVLLGSEKRREVALKRATTAFAERWGEGRRYCVHVPDGVAPEQLRAKLEVFLLGARQGDRFLVILPRSLYRGPREGLLFLHENIRLLPLPRFTGARGKQRFFESAIAQEGEIAMVAAVDGIPFPWSDDYLPFTVLAERIRNRYFNSVHMIDSTQKGNQGA